MRAIKSLKAGFFGFFLAIAAAICVAIVGPVLIIACVLGSPAMGAACALAAFFERPKPRLDLQRAKACVAGLRSNRAQKEIIPETN